ncbi:MAG: rod shape-determining protein [Acetobacter sp.]|nr:rod shape-determining protein [Bacteroides sp.]MCM1341495.1 rod shape-determining protein [Acetobacter sp.]MCM1433717.1 rod shape-determining protein [Clostridiales bacterium]
MFGYDLGIDFGTSSVIISVVGKGVVLEEPAFVAYDEEKEKIIYAGKRAYYLQGREPQGIKVIQPIVNGAVGNYSLACQMIRSFMNKVLKKSIFKPRVVAAMPSVSTDVEKRTLISAIISAGARSVCLIEEPICAAFGSGVDPLNPAGVFVINIGAGTTDMAIVSQGSMNRFETIKTAGDSFDEAIIRYVRDNYDLYIGLRTAEEIKKNIGCAVERENDITMEIKGRNSVSGLPKTIEVTGNEICACLQDELNKIISTAKSIIEHTSPQLVSDVTNGNLLLSGGSAQLYGMDTMLSEALRIDVNVVPHPVTCVSKGCEVALKKMSMLDQYGYSFKTKEEVRTR